MEGKFMDLCVRRERLFILQTDNEKKKKFFKYKKNQMKI